MPSHVSARYSVKRYILAVFVKTSDFDYTLPPGLIAQIPIEPRDRSRLMVLNREGGSIEHRRFFEITDYLHQGDVLVFNDSRVIPARLKGHRQDSGGKVEILLLRRVSAGLWEALVRPGRRLRVGSKIEIPAGASSEKTLTAEIGELDPEKTCTIKILGDTGKKELFLDLDDDLSLLGLPHLCNWLGSDLWLGVHTVDLTEQLAKYFDVKDGHGILISEVVSESPAEKAGLKAGDILIKADGEPVEDMRALTVFLETRTRVGERAQLSCWRDGQVFDVEVTLGERRTRRRR